MSPEEPVTTRPSGGLLVGDRLRAWRWDKPAVRSAPVRCRRDEWYLARMRARGPVAPETAAVLVHFLADGAWLHGHCLRLHAVAGAGGEHGVLLGWFETPEDATHLSIERIDPRQDEWLEAMTLHGVAERDPKCHPLVNTPRWSAQRVPRIRRVLLPAELESLESVAGDLELEELPARAAELRAAVGGDTALILDDERAVALGPAGVAALAGTGVVIVSLAGQARLLEAAGVKGAGVTWRRSVHGLMSARVEYSDWTTRGFALQDVLPYGVLDDEDRFAVRVLRKKAGWRRYAEEHGAAVLLASETPWTSKCGDVLAAARPVAGGELICSDAPWMAAGALGRAYAPRLLRHVVRMLLGAACGDHLQYWCRWDDTRVILRDIGELRRYEPLSPVRWRSDGLGRFGVACVGAAAPRRHLVIRTGRIDHAEPHDGIAPEPMMVFMKWLAREVREGTPWARRHLADTVVTWQFDAGAGLYYAPFFDSAAQLPERPRPQVLRMHAGPRSALERLNGSSELALAGDGGLLGEGALVYQEQLTRWLRRWIEQRGGAGGHDG